MEQDQRRSIIEQAYDAYARVHREYGTYCAADSLPERSEVFIAAFTAACDVVIGASGNTTQATSPSPDASEDTRQPMPEPPHLLLILDTLDSLIVRASAIQRELVRFRQILLLP